MFLYDPIGKTLAEIHKDCGANYNGYAVFVLRDENDKIGKQIDEDISIDDNYIFIKDCEEMGFIKGKSAVEFMKGGEE